MSLQVIISILQSRNHLIKHIAYGDTTGVVPTFEIPSLPAIVSLKKIYADLLGYLFDHGTPALTILILILTFAKARGFFKNDTVDGTSIWARLGHQVTICLATPNGWETSQQVRPYCPSMIITFIYNDTRHRPSFVKRASSVDYCQSTTTSLAYASLPRVKPQYIMPSPIPNLPNGFARELCSLLSMPEDPPLTQRCTSVKRPLPSSSSRKSVRASAYRQGVCLSIVQLSSCSRPNCKVVSLAMTCASEEFWESLRGRPSVSLMGPRCHQSSSLAWSAEMSTLKPLSDIDLRI